MTDNTICCFTDCCRKEEQRTDFNTNLTSQAGGLDENLVKIIMPSELHPGTQKIVLSKLESRLSNIHLECNSTTSTIPS